MRLVETYAALAVVLVACYLVGRLLFDENATDNYNRRGKWRF
jgi:flagellar biogenesis protein FliO